MDFKHWKAACKGLLEGVFVCKACNQMLGQFGKGHYKVEGLGPTSNYEWVAQMQQHEV